MSDNNPKLYSGSLTWLRSRTAWLTALLFAFFIYAQWPTRTPPQVLPQYHYQNLGDGMVLRWEAEPSQQSVAGPVAWALHHRGMSFLVQADRLVEDFAATVMAAAEQDRATVAGAEQEPLAINGDFASYAYFDAAARIQRHQWYRLDDRWLKLSVLYRASSETHAERTQAFFTAAALPPTNP